MFCCEVIEVTYTLNHMVPTNNRLISLFFLWNLPAASWGPRACAVSKKFLSTVLIWVYLYLHATTSYIWYTVFPDCQRLSLRHNWSLDFGSCSYTRMSLIITEYVQGKPFFMGGFVENYWVTCRPIYVHSLGSGIANPFVYGFLTHFVEWLASIWFILTEICHGGSFLV